MVKTATVTLDMRRPDLTYVQLDFKIFKPSHDWLLTSLKITLLSNMSTKTLDFVIELYIR